MKYTCYIREGYLFAEIDGLGIALIDSGAAGSISERDMATIAGKEVRFTKSVLGQSIKSISQILDTEIDALIGADILSKFEVFIDLGEGTLILTDEPLKVEGKVEPIELGIHNIIIIKCTLNGKGHRFILDTGARVSYLALELAVGYEVTGTATDFFPGFGRFETETREAEIGIGGTMLRLRFGTLPMMLEQVFRFMSADGIIGTELLDYFNIGLSTRRKEMTLQKVGGM